MSRAKISLYNTQDKTYITSLSPNNNSRFHFFKIKLLLNIAAHTGT